MWVTEIFTRHQGGVKGRQNQPVQNQELVPKRGTTSVAWARVLKHCSLIQTDFKPLKHKQQSYMHAPSLCLCERSALFSALLALNDYLNTRICVRIPVFASILINTAIKVLRASKRQEEKMHM